MELRHLRYFAAVVERKGYREAARHLNVAQPAISQTIGGLEEELGLKLFVREGRGVKLTPAGTVFYEESLRTLEQSELAVKAAQQAARGGTGTLRIAYPSVATSSFLPTLVKQYKERFPNVKLIFRELTHAAQEAALRQDRIDVSITRPPFHRDLAETLDAISLVREPLIAAVPLHYNLKSKRLAFKQLAGEKLIICQRDSAPTVYDAVIRICNEQGFSANIEYESDAMQTSLTLVSAGEGIAILPMMCALNLRHEEVRIVRLQPDAYRSELTVAWPKDSESSVLTSFIKLVRESQKEIESAAMRELAKIAG
jgi:DNA-binding transcriptional LysR family regulator